MLALKLPPEARQGARREAVAALLGRGAPCLFGPGQDRPCSRDGGHVAVERELGREGRAPL
eukprot:6246890-Lingulodinium_polyedra.AAC.1